MSRVFEKAFTLLHGLHCQLSLMPPVGLGLKPKQRWEFCIWNFNYHHIFCHIAGKSWLASSKGWRKPEYSEKNTA